MSVRLTGSSTPRRSPVRIPVVPNVIPIASNFGLGNSFPRPLRGAAVPLVDFSLHKQFRIREQQIV